ncbi:MAG: Holliday junction branch migration protein RuvA [Oscillospiraceae bacterium]
MIYSVKGELTHTEPTLAVIECGGVGYACRTTFSTLSQIGEIGKTVKLFTYLNVREDCVELFGFATLQELNCFKMLTSVSGVGPKAGLAILSNSAPEKLALAIATGDSKLFTQTKGVGPKLAQRIVLELKDKVAKQELSATTQGMDFSPISMGGNSGEAIAALEVLGYSQSEAATVVAGLDQSLTSSEMIRLSLQAIGKMKR